MEQDNNISPEDGAADNIDESPVSLRIIMREQATEEDLPLTKNITLKKIIGGEFLNTAFIKRQIWLILLVMAFIVVYISNRYKCQKDLIQINELKDELVDAKYRALSSRSELTQKIRESKVLETLHDSNDSTLHIATQPPYIVNVPSEGE